jgi:hypothetical protein
MPWTGAWAAGNSPLKAGARSFSTIQGAVRRLAAAAPTAGVDSCGVPGAGGSGLFRLDPNGQGGRGIAQPRVSSQAPPATASPLGFAVCPRTPRDFAHGIAGVAQDVSGDDFWPITGNLARRIAACAYSFRLLPKYKQSIGLISLKRPCLNWRGMYKLKLICRTMVGLFKQACLLPHFVSVALKQRRRQFALNVLEAERLDRIRNPSKYLGK